MVTVVDHCHSMTVWPLNMSDIKQTRTQDWLISHTWLNVMYLCATHINPSWEMRSLLFPTHLCLSYDLLTSCNPKKQNCGPTLCFGRWTTTLFQSQLYVWVKYFIPPLFCMDVHCYVPWVFWTPESRSPGRGKRLPLSCWGRRRSLSWGVQVRPGQCCSPPTMHV